MRALLRREARDGAAVLRDGRPGLDAARQLARRGERELALTLKEFAVLRYLMTRPAYVVSAEELLEHVWDENADPFTQTVRVTVGTLRRKLTVGGEEPRSRPSSAAATGCARPSRCQRMTARRRGSAGAPLGRTGAGAAGPDVLRAAVRHHRADLVGGATSRSPQHPRRAAGPGDGQASSRRPGRQHRSEGPAAGGVPGRATSTTSRRPSTTRRCRPCGTTRSSALVVMFLLSLAIGWWVAGRALRPVGAITAHRPGDRRHRPVPPDRRDRSRTTSCAR